MPINVSCHGCGKAYAVPTERAGQRFKCKACGTVVSVPADEWGFSSHDPALSGNGAGFADSDNPYAAPVSAGKGGSRISRAEALSKTNLCAIFLYIMASLSVLMHLVNAVLTIANPGGIAGPGMRAPANEAERIAQLAGSMGASVLLVVMNILVIVGAYHLQNLKKFPLAMTGAIIACIPCCGPCLVLGIPFGIWALVLLNDSRIRPHFQ
ncbi:MAG: hypothetical protein WKF77_18115 [Planctomycetaceae bacterium]